MANPKYSEPINIQFEEYDQKSKAPKKNKKSNNNDLGFGKQANSEFRMLNQDGSFNVERVGLEKSFFLNIYHQLMEMRWKYFLGYITLFYLIINLIFASLYLLFGTDSLSGIDGNGVISRYWEAFFFSTQTFTTVGYGRVSPIGLYPNIIASFESFLGLLGFALATGLLYGKFSRPQAKIKFSQNLLVSPYQDKNALIFRMVNARSNQLIDINVVVYVSYTLNQGGTKTRKFDQLTLERDFINFFAYNWNIVHPLDENSPLHNWIEKDFEESNMELLILVKGTDDTYNQSVHSRTSYKYYDMKWGKKFSGMLSTNDKGINVIDFHKLDLMEDFTLN